MANLTSISTILKSNEFLESQEKSRRYIHHKFQDFGYRLAEQLGDLEHRHIYMSLAKKENHAILQQALSFSLDATPDTNKGPIFMWKYKKIKEDLALKSALENFDHDFAMEKISYTRDRLANQLWHKEKSRMDEARGTLLHEFCIKIEAAKLNARKTTKLLNLGCGAGVDTVQLCTTEANVYGFDVSRKLVDIAKKYAKKAKLIRKKNFLEHSYSEAMFHGVWVDRFWQQIPVESEEKYLAELHKLTVPDAHVFITVRTGEPAQSWQIIEWQDDKLLALIKTSQTVDVLEMADRLGFELVEIREFEPHQMGLWLKKK